MSKMTSNQMKEELTKRLARPDWKFSYDKKEDTLRIEQIKSGKGITISLPPLIAKWEQKQEKAIGEMVYYIQETLNIYDEPVDLKGQEKNIYPVIRSSSFPKESNVGVQLLSEEHTAETRIYYALDLGNTYRLLDEKMIEKENWTSEQVKEMAKFNVRALSTNVKEDRVAGNVFYFVHSNDGYDASRILNESFLQKYLSKIEGTMVLSVPHQDVLIIGDVRNEVGYDIMAQMAMSFFTGGRIPITPLVFLYEADHLEPIFILAKNRPDQS